MMSLAVSCPVLVFEILQVILQDIKEIKDRKVLCISKSALWNYKVTETTGIIWVNYIEFI